MDFNRNLMGGKRPHKGIGKYKNLTLTQRLIAESEALEAYHKRVHQGRFSDSKRKKSK